jgi:hypothetical protein
VSSRGHGTHSLTLTLTLTLTLRLLDEEQVAALLADVPLSQLSNILQVRVRDRQCVGASHWGSERE